MAKGITVHGVNWNPDYVRRFSSVDAFVTHHSNRVNFESLSPAAIDQKLKEVYHTFNPEPAIEKPKKSKTVKPVQSISDASNGNENSTAAVESIDGDTGSVDGIGAGNGATEQGSTE